MNYTRAERILKSPHNRAPVDLTKAVETVVYGGIDSVDLSALDPVVSAILNGFIPHLNSREDRIAELEAEVAIACSSS